MNEMETMRKMPKSAFVRIQAKKPSFPITEEFDSYLGRYGRKAPFDLAYKDLLNFQEGFPLRTDEGNHTYWDWVIYPQQDWPELSRELTQIYAYLKTPDDPGFTDHLYISRVEYCNFGNTKPFRIRVVNRYNDNHDYYYVKVADASRLYGLELEHLLAPNTVDFLVQGATLVEEHIAGVPGDIFLKTHNLSTEQTRVRMAKEFVKFAERSFAKLLGDMRSYNYVIVVTQDFDMNQIRVRAIDFDQQSYEGDMKVYLPHFYEENESVVRLIWDLLKPSTIRQYQKEERSFMARRMRVGWSRVDDLLTTMSKDRISTPDRVTQLGEALAYHHQDDSFLDAVTMGDLTRRQLTKLVHMEE
ncbi:MAG: hypothetical protein ACLFP6_09965 [Spirochaetaceae bacterium]